VLKTFLSVSDGQMAAIRDASGGASALASKTLDASKKGLVQLLKSATDVTSSAIAQVRGAPAPTAATAGVSRTKEDLSFAELESYLAQQAPLLTAMHGAAAASAQRYREQAHALLDFGSSLRALAAAEGAETPLGGVLGTVGAVGTWSSSTATYEQSVCALEAFVERLNDYVRGCRGVKEAVDYRAASSVALAAALGEVDRLRALSTALANSPAPSAGAERAKAEADLAGAQAAAAAARATYAKAAAGFVEEMIRYREAFRADLRSMLLDLAHTQLRTESKLTQAWDACARKVAERAGGGGGGGGGGAAAAGGGGGGGYAGEGGGGEEVDL